MRIIKFRGWDKNFGRWAVSAPGIIEKYQRALPNVELMQFTGLKDATQWEQLTEVEQGEWLGKGESEDTWKGKEIYEGDVIEHGDYIPDAHTCQIHNTVVEYFSEEGSYNICPPTERGDYIKVIGNIFQDNHLLEV